METAKSLRVLQKKIDDLSSSMGRQEMKIELILKLLGERIIPEKPVLQKKVDDMSFSMGRQEKFDLNVKLVEGDGVGKLFPKPELSLSRGTAPAGIKNAGSATLMEQMRELMMQDRLDLTAQNFVSKQNQICQTEEEKIAFTAIFKMMAMDTLSQLSSETGKLPPAMPSKKNGPVYEKISALMIQNGLHVSAFIFATKMKQMCKTKEKKDAFKAIFAELLLTEMQKASIPHVSTELTLTL